MSVLGLCWLMLAFPGLPWRPVQPVTQRKPNSARKKELPDRGTGTKPACDRLRGSWGRSWCPVRLLPFWPCKTASKPRMWRYVADMGIMLRYVINGIELGQGWVGCRSGGAPTPHTKMQGRRQADGAMISRALRGKCPLSFYNQGKGATRKSPRGRTAIRAAPPCCPCLVPCAFPLLPPLRGRA